MRALAEIAAGLRAFFEARPGDVVAAYLFGSVARAAARAGSDVDVGILLASDPPPTLDALRLDLEGELERVLEMPVQLVVLNRAPCDLVHRVLRDGVLVLDRDPSARIRFEVRVRNEFFDLQPFLERYRRARPEPREAVP
jgi:predicted nucleotidyltransferase